MLLYTAVLLLIAAVSAKIVPPPTNVTVRCQNLTTTVHWEYSKQEPPTRFRVNIGGENWERENRTSDHQYDLSHFIWESEDHYMGFISVTVTAIQGVNESISVASKSFSYNDKKTVDLLCKLDFPPVELTLADSGPMVSFQNPVHYNKQQRGDPIFLFKVWADGTEYSGDCRRAQNICRLDIPVVKNPCVKLTGELWSNEIGFTPFREKDNVCAIESDDELMQIETHADPHVMTLVIMLVVLLLIIIGVTFLICKVKAWTMKTPPQPSTLEPLINRGPGNHIVSESDPVRVEVVAPNRKKSLPGSLEESNQEIDHCGRSQDDNSAGSDLQHAPVSLYQERRLSESSSSEELEAGGQRTDDDSPDDSVKTDDTSVDSMEEEDRSPYDRPHAHVAVDVGDGEMVEAYK
ncbi:interferon gamma receptor 1 [Scomber japonicus]|uniref:interferon gamma receptor 1 n=1 Tax=Scomber japonicus TaxID=13676 RepID=UPI0023059A31|nr:interferon gamma receptor 1 [Scomber japonicus]